MKRSTDIDDWTFGGYWAMVLGASRSADDVVREFELDPTDRRNMAEVTR